MWLRNFLSKGLPYCRTMIYGYDPKLVSHGIDIIMDYGRELMEELKKGRNTGEVSAVYNERSPSNSIRPTAASV